MSGSRRSAKARGDKGKQLTGWAACGSNVEDRLNDLRDNVIESGSREQSGREHNKMRRHRCRRRRRGTHYHCAVAAGLAERRFRRVASSLGGLPITIVWRGNTAAGAERRAALLSLTIPCTYRLGNQHGKKQRECSQYSDEALVRHSKSIPE